MRRSLSRYAALLLSANASSVDLLDPAVWTLSGELPFSAVAASVPPTWNNATVGLVVPQLGWLEGNAVEPTPDTEGTVAHILLRVNSQPAGNKAALLGLAAPDAPPVFVAWVDFPGCAVV
jgi:hypothetical protein